MVGKTLAHYEIIALLGRGGMGEVYHARDRKLGREVALKLLPPELTNDPERRARLEREARSVAALNHPNVVTLYAVEDEGELPFLVMEYVSGRTLDAVVPEQGLSLERFFALALPLTEAVAAAHARGITHRDLKPQNVMINADGRLKVLDFGLAKALDPEPRAQDETVAVVDVTRDGVIVGTAAYMSPEQAEGKPVDARSDVFSLGALLYQMVTGRQPFKGDTHMSTMTAVLRDEPRSVLEIRPNLPRHLARILRRCLEKNPDRRYESARGLNYELGVLRDEVLSGEHERTGTTAAPGGGRAAAERARTSDSSATDATVLSAELATSRASAAGVSAVGSPAVGSPAAGAPTTAAPLVAATGRRARRSPWIVAAAAVIALVAGALWLRFGGTASETAATATAADVPNHPAVPTIVVFPFENLGPPEDAYFAAGITDEIITSLTGVDGLRVVSRASSRHYDRTGKTLQDIATDLGVDYVLEGSVRWQRRTDGESRVRVTPQLMDATTDQQAWAHVYDRSMEEIFKVQSDIAGEVVASLGVELAVTPPHSVEEDRSRDVTAYHAYLRAQEILQTSRFDAGSWFLAVDLLEKAVERDPSFHEAWVALARANSGLCHFDWDRTEARLARAKAAVDRAFALEPENLSTSWSRATWLRA